MKRTVRLLLWVGLLLGGCILPSNVADALGVIDDQMSSEPQLYISAYQRDEFGLGLSFVQLYNNSDEPINLHDWTIYMGGVADTNRLEIETLYDGLLEPDSHVIISYNNSVLGATYQLLRQPQPTLPADKMTLTLVPPQSGLRTVVYDMKFTKVSSTKNIYTDVWQRNQTTTGYSSTTSSFTATSTQSLFDNGLYQLPGEPDISVVEIYPYASDCDPFDDSVLCGDYVKLRVHNRDIDLSNYVLRTDSSSSSRTTSNTISLEAVEINNLGYIILHRTNLGDRMSLTNSGGYVWIEDRYGLGHYQNTMTHYSGATSDWQGWSYALGTTGVWEWTATPQPLADNVITIPVVVEEIKPCPVGQYRNPETNRCRAIEEAVNALATCPEGQYRNPDTNRCKSNVLSAVATLVPCGEGQERNPATNRCRSIASAVAELIPCDEGYERNPETNRCRKMIGELSSVSPSLSTPGVAAADTSNLLSNPYALATVVALGGAGYALYEWRSEISGGYKRLIGKLGKK